MKSTESYNLGGGKNLPSKNLRLVIMLVSEPSNEEGILILWTIFTLWDWVSDEFNFMSKRKKEYGASWGLRLRVA